MFPMLPKLGILEKRWESLARMLQKIQAVWEFYAPWRFQAGYKVKKKLSSLPKKSGQCWKKFRIFFQASQKLKLICKIPRKMFQDAWRFRAELETFIQAAPHQKNPWHLPPIIVLCYMKESMLATTSIELRNMRQIKKRLWNKMKKPFEIKVPNLPPHSGLPWSQI